METAVTTMTDRTRQNGPAQPPQSQRISTLPPITALTGSLPPPELSPGIPRPVSDARDSGNWSISQSKHSSTVSNPLGGLQLQSILNAEESPSRSSAPETPHSARGSAHQPVPTPHVSTWTSDPRASADAASVLADSRRSSVDSRVNNGFHHLSIGPTSPYASENPSRTSLTSALARERGITGAPINGNPLSPTQPMMRNRAQVQPRRAPVIHPNPRSVSGMPDPTAAAPTKGFAWAFPDHPEPDDRRDSSSGDSLDPSIPSRQNSFAASVNSNTFTDGVLPAGQRRFDEDIPTHHHSMQHRAIANLQQAEQGANAGPGNYSRTPALRVSHKMAERKRRSEMKQLFDELNAILPNSPGGKSSKWEVLTKSIDHIRSLKVGDAHLRRDHDRLADTTRHLEDENRHLRAEIHALWQHAHRNDPSVSPASFGPFTNVAAHEPSAPVVNGGGPRQGPHPPPPSQQPHPQQAGQTPGVSPPQAPLPQGAAPPQQSVTGSWNGVNGAVGPSAMQGVEFQSPRIGYEHR
ncbi:hypothetical protein P152DRAFT_501047 [Eremomyces bilateralis CBS 781.70]|uniref:BHLH domain-containing protein n=1 Tax=Eremomyces bilateralis CBS 781.70 TaxID=1392243 RepID=A0A6G1G6E9_9PEZI|nr:uncharacterized protein P152DRAFT_501047 [Eremomyces bilateralis CBS 781.70]KAF1813647.1 hypothetical protein P152DRAFT_501047 [Eremomyces bilateralis CBS 781.70]